MARGITVKEFRDQLIGVPDDDIITFGALDFYRIKRRGPNLLDVEFNQQIYRDENGKLHIDE